MIDAVVEIGTNSVKYTVGELKDGKISFPKDVNVVTRLGEGLDKNGVLGFDAIERTAKAVADYVEQAHVDGAEQVEIVGTMALRNARNTNDFARRVKDLASVDLRVIPGTEEAELSFKAVLDEVHGSMTRDMVMFDMGGGSTEFVYSSLGKMAHSFSVNVGSVRLVENFLPTAPAPLSAISKLKAVIRAELVRNGLKGRPACLVGTGGNLTTLFMVKYEMPSFDSEKLTGLSISKTELEALIKTLASKSIDERKAMTGMNPDRADVVLAGACIALTIMEITESRSLTLSLRGLRHALLKNMLTQ